MRISDTMTSGQRLRAVRLAAGLTQVQLAERLEISQRYLSDLEVGRRKASFPWLIEAANKLGWNPVDLLPEIGIAIAALQALRLRRMPGRAARWEAESEADAKRLAKLGLSGPLAPADLPGVCDAVAPLPVYLLPI